MCGISGMFSLGSGTLPDTLEAMNDSLKHRGPDEAGYFRRQGIGLAMRRLSIIGVDDGHQPIFNENRDVTLVFNGEIYNYRSLKESLKEAGHRFSTHSDVEVVVHLYEDCGDAFIDRIQGMFSLALYDRRRDRLLLARDRSGQKPLYYALAQGCLIFGSEIKAIHASGMLPKDLDQGALKSFLAYGFVVGENTLFRGVRKLPAGHSLAAADGETTLRQYWDLPLTEGPPTSPEDAATRVRELLEAAVHKRLMSEVPLGAFLSGGIDSSAVVALMAPHLDSVQTFCVGFEDSRFDELPHARAVANHFGTRHHELILRGCNLGLLRDLNWHYDEPAGDPAAVPTYCLARFARQHITVALTGEGGDETFAGYPHHRNALRVGRLEARLPVIGTLARCISRLEGRLGGLGKARFWKAAWIAGLPTAERHRGWVAATTDSELERLLHPDLRAGAHNGSLTAPFLAASAKVSDRHLLDQLLYVDSKLSLADQLLMKVDKTTMAASLEARCPLLDQDLLEYAMALPTNLKLATSGGGKVVLRQALRGLVPDDVLDRPKQGFDVPLETWLLRDLEDAVTNGLLAGNAPVSKFLDLGSVRRTWHRFKIRRDMRSSKQIWRLLNLAVWHDIHWPSGWLEELPSLAPKAYGTAADPTNELFVERSLNRAF